MGNDHIVMPEDHMDRLYNSDNILIKFVHRNRLNEIVKCMPVGKNQEVLDAGCGEGHLLERLHKKNKNNHFFGIDVTKIALEKAAIRCNFADLRMADLLNTGYEDAFFDVIFCTEVLEHIYEYQKVICELKRILKPNGSLIITLPNEGMWRFARFLLMRRPFKVSDHVNSFNDARMKSYVGMNLVSERGLPFKSLPFFISFGYLMHFVKK